MPHCANSTWNMSAEKQPLIPIDPVSTRKATVKFLSPDTNPQRLVVQTSIVDGEQRTYIKYLCECHRKIKFVLEGSLAHHKPSFVDSDQESVLSISSIRSDRTPIKRKLEIAEVTPHQPVDTPVKRFKLREPIEFVDCSKFVSPRRPSFRLDSIEEDHDVDIPVAL